MKLLGYLAIIAATKLAVAAPIVDLLPASVEDKRQAPDNGAYFYPDDKKRQAPDDGAYFYPDDKKR